MSEFYGDPATAETTDPADDPILTVRMAPPDTQPRRLDLNTPRAVRVATGGPLAWVRVMQDRSLVRFMAHGEVADWPVQHPLTVSAAQRLARPAATTAAAGGHIRDTDEDERPFR